MSYYRLREFRAGGKHFATLENWAGLWADVNELHERTGTWYEPDGHHPDYHQVSGTSQVIGESAVRRTARELAEVRDGN